MPRALLLAASKSPEVTVHASPTRLVIAAAISIALIIVLITWTKLHPFLALLLGSAALAVGAGIGLSDTFTAFSSGLGSTVGGVGVLIAFGAMIGGLLVASGAADRIVDTFLERTPAGKLPWVMAALAFIIGIPLFFEVGLVLLIPVIMLVARRVRQPIVLLGIPALAGLSALHGLVPPHPGPLLAISALHANLGLTLALGLLVAVPTVVIAGPLAARFMARWVPVAAPDLFVRAGDAVGAKGADAEGADASAPAAGAQGAGHTTDRANRRQPSFAVSLSVILLPVVLMLARTVVETAGLPKTSPVRVAFDFLGDPIVALLLTTLFAMAVLGVGTGRSLKQTSSIAGDALGPIAGILLIVGAGGGFKQTLVDTGVAGIIGGWIHQAPVSPLIAGWLVAVAIRLATGSATVATITAAGIMAPVATGLSDPHAALLVLAIGVGSVFFSHVNDAGFWLVKEYFGLSVGQTLKTWSLMETILSVTGLGAVLLLSLVL
ncbi:GntT/GntP/DsdX family permease [Corynebacterium heidelbergense]|uniref:Gluconate transporter n=1 Tax=Corynebacterium heidelbergense TaxID=2055947 RepID=A0A364V7E9_9CORY|nr:gluconate transporter [Corynebacterium heidelbergense]